MNVSKDDKYGFQTENTLELVKVIHVHILRRQMHICNINISEVIDINIENFIAVCMYST